jgi:hypothetical protein
VAGILVDTNGSTSRPTREARTSAIAEITGNADAFLRQSQFSLQSASEPMPRAAGGRPQVGLFPTGSSWPSRVSVGRPDQAPPVPEIRRGKQSSDDHNTRVSVSPPASPDPKHNVVDHDQAFRCGWASVTGAHPAPTAVNAGKGHWGRVQRMHASACCSGEFSEFGVHAKALEGLRSLRATTYHLLRNLTCRDYLRAWVRVRPRTYWGRMMPEKILGTRSARSGGLSARARPGGHWGRMIARPVVASPCSG